MSARNPDRPRLLAHLTLPSAVIDFAIAHERVVVPLKDGLRVIDRRSRAFSTVGQWTSTTAFNSVALAGTLAVLVHDRDVTVVDLSDPQRPHRVGTGHMTYPGDGARDVVTAGRYALCRDYDDVYALDLANPRRPVLADYFITWDHYELVPKQLATDGPRCFVAAKESGLLVLELGNGTRRTTAAI